MFNDFTAYLRQLKVYAFGQGMLSIAMFVAVGVSAAFGISAMLPALVVGIGGTLLTAVDRIYNQSLYKDRMVDAYRSGLALQFGIDPQDVTREHLYEATKVNHVIAQELEKQHKKTILTIGTAVLSGIVSIALIGMFGMGKVLNGLAQESFTGAMAPLAQFIGMGTVSTITGLVLHKGLDAVIGHSAGLDTRDPNDLILKMHHQVERGQPVSREQVYDIVVANDTALGHTIRNRFHKSYNRLSYAQQEQVLQVFGMAKTMDQLAVAINQKQMQPGQLAFMINDLRTNEAALEQAETTVPAVSFVQKLGFKPHEKAGSHIARIDAQRSMKDTELYAAK